MSTHSDLNFEIERRFREEGIEIPYSQTDVFLKNAPEIVKAVQAMSAAASTPRQPSRRAAEGTMGDGDGD